MVDKKNLTSVPTTTKLNDEIITTLLYTPPPEAPPLDTAYAYPAFPAIPRKKYEYTKMSNPSVTAFNEMGSQGWRLISEEGRWSTWEREIV